LDKTNNFQETRNDSNLFGVAVFFHRTGQARASHRKRVISQLLCIGLMSLESP